MSHNLYFDSKKCVTFDVNYILVEKITDFRFIKKIHNKNMYITNYDVILIEFY